MMTKEKVPVPGQEPNDLVRLYALFFNELYEVTEGLEEPLDSKYYYLMLYSIHQHNSCL